MQVLDQIKTTEKDIKALQRKMEYKAYKFPSSALANISHYPKRKRKASKEHVVVPICSVLRLSLRAHR